MYFVVCVYVFCIYSLFACGGPMRRGGPRADRLAFFSPRTLTQRRAARERELSRYFACGRSGIIIVIISSIIIIIINSNIINTC